MRWWPWARRTPAVVVPPRTTTPVLPAFEPHRDEYVAPAGGVRLVMGDGTAVELPPDTPQAKAFAAVAEVLVEGLPVTRSGSSQPQTRR